jgi:hypothetical protein
VTKRQLLLTIGFLCLVALAHAAARVTQIGGAQFAPSVAIYVLMALLLAPQLGWVPLIGIAAATGILTTLTTSTDPPTPNLLAHSGGFLAAAGLAKLASRTEQAFKLRTILGILAISLAVSWTLFATTMWLLLAGTPFAAVTRERFGVSFGQGFLAWWLFGFVSIGIPTYIVGVILLPLLYGAVRPALVRQGMLPTEDEWLPAPPAGRFRGGAD